MSDAVNPSKGPTPKERSGATRARITHAAYLLFCERGYPATTLEAIASAAGVAIQTVKFVFHTKAQILLEVINRTAAGGDNRPVPDRPWFREALTASDPHRVLALCVDNGTDIYVRLGPLTAAINEAAALDEEVAKRRNDTLVARRGGMAMLVGAIERAGRLRPGLTLERATDVIFVLQSPENFHAFTSECGWSVNEWKAWQFETLCGRLLDTTSALARRRATSRTSFGAPSQAAL